MKMIDSEPRRGTITETHAAEVQCLGTYWHTALAVPCSLHSFFNKPFLHHVADRLVERGLRSIDFICHRDKPDLAKCLGTGVRWGAKFRFFTSRESRTMDEKLDSARKGDVSNRISVASHTIPCTGALASAAEIVRVDSPRHYLDSQIGVMRRGPSDFLTIEQEIAESQWVGRNVRIHPSATLEGPVVIGENTRVGPGVFLGPFTVVGPNCVLGRNSLIAKSTVMPGVYVGEGLEVSESIVFGDRVFNVRLGTSIAVSDSLLVSRIG